MKNSGKSTYLNVQCVHTSECWDKRWWSVFLCTLFPGPTMNVTCGPHSFLCREGDTSHCIPDERVCNGKHDCRHGDDERNCTHGRLSFLQVVINV